MPPPSDGGCPAGSGKSPWWSWEYAAGKHCTESRRCLYGATADRLWVRETWSPMCRVADPHCYCEDEEHHYVEYRADTDNWAPGEWPREAAKDPDRPRWKPSIFMLRTASRITLEVTEVRVERVQDISEEDAVAEGMKPCHTDAAFIEHDIAKHQFRAVWDSMYLGRKDKPGLSWAENPWVWCLTFKRIT